MSISLYDVLEDTTVSFLAESDRDVIHVIRVARLLNCTDHLLGQMFINLISSHIWA